MNIPHQYQLFSAADSRALDQRTIEEFGIDGFTLMEIAGTRAADFILNQFPNSAKGLVVCGRGNNAGDALVVARILAEHNTQITLFFVDGDENLSPDCERNYHLLQKLACSNVNIQISNHLEEVNSSYDFIIDGMLGTGLNAEVRTPYKEVIQLINGMDSTIFAMDIPTGLHADDGSLLGSAVRADYTFAFGTMKKGFYIDEGYDYCGEIIFCELPFPSYLKESNDYILRDEWLSKIELKSTKRSHKYDGGVVYIIAGSEGLTGAAILASLSAWNTGVGAVVLITPKGLLPIYDEHLIHIIKKPVGSRSDVRFSTRHSSEVDQIISEKSGVVLIGPGLGREKETIQFVQQLLSTFQGEVVIDADALFALSNSEEEFNPRAANWVLTPHPGELYTLVKGSNETRSKAAKNLSKTSNAVVLSKGLPSLVISPDGTSIYTDYDTRIFSRAGFGDVLAGKIAGFHLIEQHRELACCLALSDGKSKAFDFLKDSTQPLEPLDII